MLESAARTGNYILNITKYFVKFNILFFSMKCILHNYLLIIKNNSFLCLFNAFATTKVGKHNMKITFVVVIKTTDFNPARLQKSN